jgi:hypothetical protein
MSGSKRGFLVTATVRFNICLLLPAGFAIARF